MQPAETTLDSDSLFRPFPGDLLYPGSDGRWLSEQGAQVQLSGLFLSLLNIVLFGLLGSLVSVMFGLPDILENMKAFATAACDGVQLLFFPRHTVHFKGKRGSL